MTWWHRLTHRQKMEDQLANELAFHVEQLTADLTARGHSAAEARRLARLELGGPEQVKEECRDARGTRWVEDFFQDVRYAIRTLRQRPGFAAVALLSLALGTGATTVMFSLIDGVMLQPFAYRDSRHLVRLWEQTDWSTQFGSLWAFTYPNYLDCRRAVSSLEMAVWEVNRGTLSEPGAAEFLDGIEASHELFPLLGVNVELGRVFLPEEDKPGAEPVALISHSVWQRHFGGSREALGAQLIFDGHSYTVVGVLPAAFRLEDDRFDVFTPAGQDTSPAMQNRGAHAFRVWARPRPGARLGQVQTELTLVGQRLANQYPDTNKGRTFVAQPLKPDLGDTKQTLYLLLGAVVLVLLIACANIASLLLARAVGRERELAVRAALGASRWRLARQTLTESLVLSAIGGAAGCALAWMLLRIFIAIAPAALPRLEEATIDVRVLLFTLGAALASGLLFGLAPALRRSGSLVVGGVHSTVRTRGGLRSALVTLEIAFSMVLLTGAGLLLHSLWKLESVPMGMQADRVVTARFVLGRQLYSRDEQQLAFFNELERRLAAVPGVEAMAITDSMPPSGSMRGRPLASIDIEGQPRRPEGSGGMVAWRYVTPGYFATLGIPIVRGRPFSEQDRDPAASATILSESLARRMFPHEDPLGKRILKGPQGQWTTVIGVARDVTNLGAMRESWPEYYIPRKHFDDFNFQRQEPPTGWRSAIVIARTAIDPKLAASSIRAVLGALDPALPVAMETMPQRLREMDQRPRFYAVLLAVFAAMGVLIAAVGLFGVMSFLVAQGTREIGVRMALGATPGQIVRMTLTSAARWTAAGVAIGAGGSFAAARLLRSLLFHVEPGDPAAVGAAMAILCAVVLLAAVAPARRASQLDPGRTLHQE